MKRPVVTIADQQLFDIEARRFADWLAAMLAITLASYGAKSRQYRQTLRLAKYLTEWRAALATAVPPNERFSFYLDGYFSRQNGIITTPPPAVTCK